MALESSGIISMVGSSPTVSVIVPVFNRAETIGYCINSILTQSYQDFELIIIDDCSTDNWIDVVKDYGDPRIRIASTKSNSGPSVARNLGINLARGHWIAFLDSDDRWKADKLEKQMVALEAVHFDPWSVVYTHFVVFHPEYALTKDYPEFQAEGSNAYPVLLREWGPLLQGTLVSREALEKVGFLDENLDCWEDWDLAIRLSRHCNYIYLREPLFIYHLHLGNRICNDKQRFRRGYYNVLKKHESEIKRICGLDTWKSHIECQIRESLAEKLIQIVDCYEPTVSGCFIGMPTTMASAGPHRAPGRLVCENSA
jgi:glycosyltransferase involved in cell wall biosynthesis